MKYKIIFNSIKDFLVRLTDVLVPVVSVVHAISGIVPIVLGVTGSQSDLGEAEKSKSCGGNLDRK